MRRLAFLVVVVVALTACAAGGGAAAPTTATSPLPTSTTVASSTSTTEAAFPVTIHAANGEVTLQRRPERIISLSPTATEMLFAVGAGPQVVAVDSDSNFPSSAPQTDLSGYQPNIEAIAGYRPDLVVVSNDIDGMVAALRKVDVPVLLMPAAAGLGDVYAQIEQLGAGTGHDAEAADLVAQMQSEIEDVVASTPNPATPLSYYHELDPTLYTVTSSTFIGKIYGLFGLHNIADPADTEGSGYPQLTAEYVVSQNPDMIFLADTKCCGQTAETVAARPAWGELAAVRRGEVIALDDDVASRWGPRVVQFVRRIAGAVTSIETPA